MYHLIALASVGEVRVDRFHLIIIFFFLLPQIIIPYGHFNSWQFGHLLDDPDIAEVFQENAVLIMHLDFIKGKHIFCGTLIIKQKFI